MENNTNERLHIFIDEASTLGFKKLEPYFMVCALILNEQSQKSLKNSVKRILKLFRRTNPNLNELHASQMTFSEKTIAHNEFKKHDFKISYLVAHKESIHENLFKKKNVCFNYFVYLALKNTLEKTHLREIFVTIDTRSVKVTSEKSLEEYLNTELASSGIYNKNVHVMYGDSKNFKLLQVADLFANAIYAKYNFEKNHFYSYLADKICDTQSFPQWHFDKK